MQGAKSEEPMYSEGVWTKRFIIAALAQGAVVTGLTLFLVLGSISLMKTQVAMVMASGGAGTWVTFGYVMYILVGVIGVAVSALFYHYLAQIGRYSRGNFRIFPWMHLVLMNTGITVAASLMMYAGYVGGSSMLSPSVGGLGFNAGQAHELIGQFVAPISIAILVTVAGVVAGGMGFLLSWRSHAISKMNGPSKLVR